MKRVEVYLNNRQAPVVVTAEHVVINNESNSISLYDKDYNLIAHFMSCQGYSVVNEAQQPEGN